MDASTRAVARSLALLLVAVGGSAAAPKKGAHPPHWDYVGEVGPQHWAEFGSDFAACAGRNQSPIDLDRFIEAQLPPLEVAYRAGGSEVVNNGHAIQVNYAKGSTLSLDGTTFELKQFHFHAPSENHLKGKSFPIEAHLVHADAQGNLAVVALLFEQGAPNPVLAPVWAAMPAEEGRTQALSPPVSASALLPGSRDYYRYDGSLTTPPCSEGVRWLVIKQPVTASAEQIRALTRALGRPNNRPVQPIGARVVLE